jgi:hypothetical protein
MNQEKNYLDGIQSPIQKRSIRDIPVPTRKPRNNDIDLAITKNPLYKKPVKKSLDLREEQRKRESTTLEDLAEEFEEPITQTRKHSNHNRNNHYDTEGFNFWPWLVTIGSVLVVIVLFFGISAFFSNAKILITPKTTDLANLNIDIPIINETVGNKDLLNYKILEIEASSSKIVDSEKEELVENKASGVITVYNEYTKNPQKLIQNTRFETPEGLIYRIKNSITVPGYTESSGNKIPGSIDVEVFADEANEKYNIGKTDFKIPGFKNQEQYDYFYAKSKTEITGGFVGTKNTVSTNTLDATVLDLQGQITDQILQKIKSQNTDNYIYVYQPDNFNFLEPKQINASGKKVEINLIGTAKIYVFAKSELSQKIAEKGGREYDNAPVLVKEPEKLNLIIKNNSIQSGEEILQNNEILNISGDAKIVWQNDLEQIKKDLADKDKKQLSQIISNYPGIVKASASFSLLWNSHFSKNINKINIEITE